MKANRWTRWLRSWWGAVGVALLALDFCGFGRVAAEPPTVVELRDALLDLDGVAHHLAQNDRRATRVVVFLSPECPIANGSLPTLDRLARRWSEASSSAVANTRVEFFGVIVGDPTLKRSDAARHYHEFALSFPILFDASGVLADQFKPSHVPECFVIDPDNRLVYRGAIDNAWEAVGKRRLKAERTYLADALDALAREQPIPIARTTPVGCPIETFNPRAVDPQGREQPAIVTYTRDIAPILQARCVVCHRPGQVAPFSLTRYEEAAKRADWLAQVAEERLMPPWIPGPGDHRFVGDRRLSDRELALLRIWADSGRAQGDPEDLPPTPVFDDNGWRLGTPDLVVRMTEPFEVPADGPDILRNFVIPLNVDEDRLVTAIEFRPGNPRVTHHAVLFLDAGRTARKLDAADPRPGYDGFGGPGFLPSGALGGWSVGNTPRHLPDGMGRHLKKGSDLVVQIHYHPTGKPETDQSEIALYFLDRSVAETLSQPNKLVGSFWVADYRIDLPPGETDLPARASYTLPRPVTLVGVVPHMHLLGKSMKATARRPDGTRDVLIDIPQWNYNWQDEYYFERPFRLPAGTVLEVEARFDNSDANPFNPSTPPRRVTWGEGTLDEMMFCFFLATADTSSDLIRVIFNNLAHDARQPRLLTESAPARQP